MRASMRDLRAIFSDMPDMLDPSLAARTLCISDNSMRSLCRSQVRHLRVGKLIRIPKQWLIEDLCAMQGKAEDARGHAPYVGGRS